MQDQEILAALRRLPASTLLDAMDGMGNVNCMMRGVHNLLPGRKLAGRAVTMRFVPSRPDLRRQVIGGTGSAEYEAIERCGPGDVLVMDAMGLAGPSAAGDIKLWRLSQRGAAGVVTDGGLRDLEAMREFGLGLFAAGETNMTMPSHMLPWEAQTAVQCGGALVLPGDYISADDGGVIVVPREEAAAVVARAGELDALEQAVKAQLAREAVSPGKYYPFNEAARRLLDPSGE